MTEESVLGVNYITEVFNTHLDGDEKCGCFLGWAMTMAQIIGMPKIDFINLCKSASEAYPGPLPDELAELLVWDMRK